MFGKKKPNSVSIRGGQRRSSPRKGHYTSNKVTPESTESCDTIVTNPKTKWIWWELSKTVRWCIQNKPREECEEVKED